MRRKSISSWLILALLGLIGLFLFRSVSTRPVFVGKLQAQKTTSSDPRENNASSLSEDQQPTYVEVQYPVRKTLYRTLVLPGGIVANQEATLYARAEGYLQTLFVDRGSRVSKGEKLAVVDVPELEKQLEKNKAEYALCRASLEKFQAEQVWRRSQYERASTLLSKSPNLISQDMLDELKGKYQVARAEVEETQTRLGVMRAAIGSTQQQIQFATLRAPFDGIITQRWVDPGDLIQPGKTKLFYLVDMNPVRVQIYVPESEVPRITSHNQALLTVEELPGQTWKAQVSRFSWALDSDTKTMLVELDVTNKQGLLRPGMFATVRLNLEAHPHALTIPAQALVVEKQETYVYRVQQGMVSKVPISMGVDDGIQVEVLKGLSDKDEIVVTGKSLVRDGDRVQAVLQGGTK